MYYLVGGGLGGAGRHGEHTPATPFKTLSYPLLSREDLSSPSKTASAHTHTPPLHGAP